MKKKNILIVAIIIVVAFTARYFYLISLNEVGMFPDTYEYNAAAESILNFKLDVSRVPIYPLFIRIAWSIFFVLQGDFAVILLQTILSSVVAIFMFYVAGKLFESKKKGLLFTLFYIINVFILGWDSLILTESVTINCVILLTGFFILYIKMKKERYIILTFLMSLVLIFIKPFYLFLPILIFLILIFYSFGLKKLKRNIILCIISLTVIYGAIYGYSYLNLAQNGYFGLTDVSAINKLGKLMQYDMYELSSDESIKKMIRDEISANGNLLPPPKAIIMKYNLNNDNYSKINKFTDDVISQNAYTYAINTIHLIIKLPKYEFFVDYNYFIANIKAGLLLKAYNTLFNLKYINIFLMFMILCFFELIMLSFKALKRKVIDWEWIFILLLICYQFIMAIAGAHGEYHRLMVPVYVLVFLIIFKYIFLSVKYIEIYGLKIQFFRYALVGGLASIVDISIYNFLTNVTNMHPIASNSISFIFGLLINYYMSRKWVFNQQAYNFKKDFSLFAIIGVIGLILSNFILFVLLDTKLLYNILFFIGEDLVKLFAKLITVVIVLFWNFIARKKLVFR